MTKVEKVVAVPPVKPVLQHQGQIGSAKKIMLCVRWDQSGIVYYKLLEPVESVNAQRYHQQMINLNHALIEK